MNLDDLRTVQADERSADSLQALPDDFYRNAAAYIEELREERARAADEADDPFGSEKVRRLTDEIETAEEVAEAIYERRMGKVVKRASLAAAGMPSDEEGLTAEEQELFSDLVAQIEAHRAEVLDAFAGERDEGSLGGGSSGTTEPEPGLETGTPGESNPGSGRADPEPDEIVEEEMAAAVTGNPPEDSGGDFDAADVMSGGDADVAGGESDSGTTETDGGAVESAPTRDAETDTTETASTDAANETDRTTVRITRDVGEIFGVDERTYHLDREDVVTLPEENAEPLIERDAARKLG